jgi:hypothetical protein
VAELNHGGLSKPVWPSWLAAFQLVYLWLDRIQTERGRMTTRVLRDVVHEMVWRGKWLLDDRHAWQIADSAKVSPRWVLESLAALERAGIAFRLHMVGVRSKKGLTSNVLVFPELLVHVLDLVPKSARAATIQFLRRTDVRAQLEAGGVWARLPEAVTGAPIAERPAGITGTQVRGTASRRSTIASSDLDRRSGSPTPGASGDVNGPERPEAGAIAPTFSREGAAAPFPPAPPLHPVALAEPPAAVEPPSGPRPITTSPATLVGETRPSAVPPATRGPGVAGSRREAWPTLPARLRGPHVPVADVVAWFEGQGVPRSRAIERVHRYAKTAAWRRCRDARGEATGRPRAQARREAKAVNAAAAAADGERDRQWLTLRTAWARAAGDADFFGWISSLRCGGWAVDGPTLVVRVVGPREVLERLVYHRAALERLGREVLDVPLHVSWEIAS